MTATADDAQQRQQEALADRGHPHRWRILAVLASVAFMAQLDLFIVNIAVPAMGRRSAARTCPGCPGCSTPTRSSSPRCSCRPDGSLLQSQWHYSAVRAGLAITPGPATAAVFAVSAGRISRRFGRVWPAVTGASLMAVSAACWIVSTSGRPSYATAILPGMLVAGASAGLTQAPLFAAAGTLPPDRATTGSAVLNMSRQVGSAVGVALVVVILGTGALRTTSFHHAWAAEIAAGTLAALAAAGSGRARVTPRLTPGGGGQVGRFQTWALVLSQLQIWTCVPGVVDDDGSSRHRPECGLISWPADVARHPRPGGAGQFGRDAVTQRHSFNFTLDP